MKKFEAKTLEEAFAQAADEFGCSITQLQSEIVQHASSGLFGLFRKNAIIVVARQTTVMAEKPAEKTPGKQREKPAKPAEKKRTETENIVPAEDNHATIETGSEEAVLESFFGEDEGADTSATASQKSSKNDTFVDEKELQAHIEKELDELMKLSCFDIDTVEVDVIDGTAYIFIDGEDAALLIGKEGYRYNALAYLISNWLYNHYNLYIKLEIAQFLASQQEMIRNYIQPVIEHVVREGWGRTRALDGVLVQIALEQLRDEFPNKYVAIKRMRDGGRYILINEFNKR